MLLMCNVASLDAEKTGRKGKKRKGEMGKGE
jgi:hypothetical protein